MKYLKVSFFIILPFIFIYIILNLNTSISTMSIVLMNFFKSLFPYLFTFLILNQILIKTNLISLLGYFIQFIFYPLFKINANGCSIMLISFINGFPSSALYSSLLVKEKRIEKYSSHKIASICFLPSFVFVFYLVKNHLSSIYFLIFIISLYIPCLILLLIKRNKNIDKYIHLKEVIKEIKLSFNNFHYINDLKYIFSNSIANLINILGMISFYSIITLIIPSLLIKGLFEFSIPSINILSNNYSDIIKTLFLLIILVFSSLSSISQASIYLDEINLNILSFIKTRIVLLSLSLIIFNLCLYFYLL